MGYQHNLLVCAGTTCSAGSTSASSLAVNQSGLKSYDDGNGCTTASIPTLNVYPLRPVTLAEAGLDLTSFNPNNPNGAGFTGPISVS